MPPAISALEAGTKANPGLDVLTKLASSDRSSGGAVRDTPHPEPGNPMATLGRRLPRIVCVRLGSARHFVELKVVRRLPSTLVPDGVGSRVFPGLSATAGYLLDGVHVQDIARAFAK